MQVFRMGWTGMERTIRERAIAETPVCSFTLQIGKCSIR
jgi:hypothetical protein